MQPKNILHMNLENLYKVVKFPSLIAAYPTTILMKQTILSYWQNVAFLIILERETPSFMSVCEAFETLEEKMHLNASRIRRYGCSLRQLVQLGLSLFTLSKQKIIFITE